MVFSRGALVAVALLALGGCTSSRIASVETAPAPLPPAPSGTVTGNKLPPPAAPLPPVADTTDTQVASLPPSGPSADAPELKASGVAGVWNASVSGQSCKVATPQTKFGQGFRAGPLRCPAPIDGVKSWNVAGKQLTLYDEGGSPLAQLYASGPEKFNGQTSSGLPISLTR